ncbi:glycosyltransferase family protein [Elizabethkingia sp. YR214]|nr:glycosyltransferase family protein [Elizabethkingia sp. YR214]
MIMEKLKVLLWTVLHLPEYRYKYWLTRKIRNEINILNSWDTVNYILEQKKSVCRFGDGELQMISHFLKKKKNENFDVDTFQSYNEELSRRLLEVFQSKKENVLICLPYQFKKASVSTLKTRLFWEREWLGRKDELLKIGFPDEIGDTNFTRFYLNRLDIPDYPKYINKLKQIWKNKKITIVEGEYSRLGVGNDFFDTAIDIKRIICPAVNAFDKYNDILNAVQNYVEKDRLVLIALGHTATVLAFDLSQLGFQSLDIGHVDIEYEWYKLNAKEKVAIPNKYVNEVSSGRIDSDLEDEQYHKQIIYRFI